MNLIITCPQCGEPRHIRSKEVTEDEHGKIAKCPCCGPFYTKYTDCSCNQCNAVMINGIYCHEKGCPNTGADKIDGEWVKPEPDYDDDYAADIEDDGCDFAEIASACMHEEMLNDK